MRFPTRELKPRDGGLVFLLDGDIGVGEVIVPVEWLQTMHCFLVGRSKKINSVLGFDGFCELFSVVHFLRSVYGLHSHLTSFSHTEKPKPRGRLE